MVSLVRSCFALAPLLGMLTRPTIHRKPSTKVEDVLLALQQLLVEPNPDDPLIPAIAEQYRTDKAGFKKEAQLQVKKVCWRGLLRPDTAVRGQKSIFTDTGSISCCSTHHNDGDIHIRTAVIQP